MARMIVVRDGYTDEPFYLAVEHIVSFGDVGEADRPGCPAMAWVDLSVGADRYVRGTAEALAIAIKVADKEPF